MKGSYSYGDAHNTIDPGTTAGSSFNLNQHAGDPNNPGLGRSQSAQGHRVFVNASYNRSYFGFGATTIAAFWEAKPVAERRWRRDSVQRPATCSPAT